LAQARFKLCPVLVQTVFGPTYSGVAALRCLRLAL